MRLPRKHAIAAAGAVAMAAAGLAVALQATRDRESLRAAQAGLGAFGEAAQAGRVDAAAAMLREAVVAAQPVLEGRWPAHAWSRTFRLGELAELRERLDAAVGSLARAVDARRVRIEALRTLRAEVDYATTVAELDAIEARRAGHGPLLAADAPEAHDALLGAMRARRAAFAGDTLRNRAALDAVEARLGKAGEDPRALLEVMDAVLPLPARGDEAMVLAALKAKAAQRRTSVLAERRLRDCEGRAALAPTSREARGALEALGKDVDLARPADPELSARIAAARASLERRIASLEAWEESMAAVDRALAAGEPDAAAVALGRLLPCDDRTRAVADSVREGFGARALDAFTSGAIAAVERADLDALERCADSLRRGAAAWQAMDEGTRTKAASARDAVDDRIDRARYDEFLRHPGPELAARYLRGWPGRLRRMAPFVEAWIATAGASPVRLTLESARWSTVGVESPARTLEDRPDAEILLQGPQGATASAKAMDIRESERTVLHGASIVLDPGCGPVAPIDARVRIDLRDALSADPVATGREAMTLAEWRAGRLSELPVRDPLWASRPHVLFLRATSPGLPALAPFPRP